MQSANYMPGVSGWKMFEDGQLEVNGAVRVVLGKAAEEKPEPKPVIIVDGVTYISEAEVERAAIANQRLKQDWSIKTVLLDDRQVFAGVGLGIDQQFLVSADKFAINGRDATETLDELASVIATTELGATLQEKIKDLLREELQPSGILHRR